MLILLWVLFLILQGDKLLIFGPHRPWPRTTSTRRVSWGYAAEARTRARTRGGKRNWHFSSIFWFTFEFGKKKKNIFEKFRPFVTFFLSNEGKRSKIGSSRKNERGSAERRRGQNALCRSRPGRGDGDDKLGPQRCSPLDYSVLFFVPFFSLKYQLTAGSSRRLSRPPRPWGQRRRKRHPRRPCRREACHARHRHRLQRPGTSWS